MGSWCPLFYHELSKIIWYAPISLQMIQESKVVVTPRIDMLTMVTTFFGSTFSLLFIFRLHLN
jgi:hypothetical protein